MNRRPILIGLAGGTASGKTTIARVLRSSVPEGQALLLELDAWYKDLSHLSFQERDRINFDHPDAFDWDDLKAQLADLIAGRAIESPIYDYGTHNRKAETNTLQPAPVVLIEGILVLWPAWLRDLLDIKVFVDTPSDVRLARRIRRDTLERERQLGSVLEQYEGRVRPMHQEFCEPTKQFADIIIPRGARNRVAIDMVAARLSNLLAERASAESVEEGKA